MMRLRPIVRSVLCCLLCLTVCGVPALAGSYGTSFPGFIYPSAGAQIIYSNGSTSLNVFDGYFPASFGVSDNPDNPGRNINGSPLPYSSGSVTLSIPSAMYIEVLYPVDVASVVTVTPFSNSAYGVQDGILTLIKSSGTGTSSIKLTSNNVKFCLDGNYTDLTKSSNNYHGIPNTFEVERYWGYRYYFDSGTVSGNPNTSWCLSLKMADYYKYDIEMDVGKGIFNQVVVNTGVLEEINGKLTEIQTSTTQLQSDVSEIKNGLQDSNSSIWQSFKDSVSGLFVPSSAELEGVKNGFDQLAQDKLGGAYQTVELVDNGVQSAVNKFKNPGSSPGVEFPGISVPLGGDTGTVTLAASQTVTIPEQITNVLYPVAGVIIPIVCVIWTIRQCTDMVECFMSGMSYAEFLHRNSDEEDDEV